MRVLINYNYQLYPVTTASYFEMELRRFDGIEVFRIGENRIPCADLILNFQPCSFVIAYPGKKSCYWEGDNHIWRGSDFQIYQKVDYVFIAQKKLLPLYPEGKTYWLPQAAYPEIHKLHPEEPLEYDVGFIGNDTYSRRRGLLDKIGAKYKLLRTSGIFGDDYSRMLSRCKIIFNCAMKDDLNMRVFEAISIGRLLLTDKADAIDEIFKDGEHYVSFEDWVDLDNKIAYYLTHKEERRKIAKAGANYVHSTQTYQHRLEKILQVCGFY